MTDYKQHPIIPPPELLDKWDNLPLSPREIFVLAAQWGADIELEACCEWLDVSTVDLSTGLRADRRPKPPSLKEQAWDALASVQRLTTDPDIIETLRRALEQLND